MKKFDLEKKVLKYSSVAGSIVAFAGAASAQIVYTDVNPDETYNEDDAYLLDVNNDLVTDFAIIQFDTVVTNTQLPFPIPAEGVVLTTVGSNGAIGFVGSQIGLPYLTALNLGDPIDNAQSFQQTGSSPMIAGAFAVAYGVGPWIDAADHYMGLTFLAGSNFHYGWCRMSMTADGLSFTIKDYAYDATPITPINAGQTFNGINEDVASSVQVNVLDNSVSINILNNSLTNGRVEVININGQVLFTKSLNSNETIDLNGYSSGIYFINLNFDQGKMNRKLFVR